MNKYDTSNYNYCINNTTAVWNLTPPVNIALIPQQHVIHQASKNKVDITDIDNNTFIAVQCYYNPPVNHITSNMK